LVGQELSEQKTPEEPAASVSGNMSPGISCSEEAGIPRFYKRWECSIFLPHIIEKRILFVKKPPAG
jgi:hypothetical protein